MNKKCKECKPEINCFHVGTELGPDPCPWHKPAPDHNKVPRGSVMDLTITNCDGDGQVDARMRLRLCMTYSREDGVLYENWISPDCPLPQPMIAEILTFLEQNGFPPGPAPDGRFVRKAELPASLIAKLMGPAWMTQFRQLTADMKQRQLLDSAPPPRRLDNNPGGIAACHIEGMQGFTYQDDGFNVEVIDVVSEPVPPGLT